MKIDCFTHVMPKDFYRSFKQAMTGPDYLAGMIEALPELMDMEARIRVMDQLGIDRQVITIASPPIEIGVADPHTAAELAVLANDQIAAMAARHPDRFIAVGALAMNNPVAMAEEARRCITHLGMKGVLIYTSARGKPLDRPEFADFFSMMAQLDYPIWLHPARSGNQADYVDEEHSKYWIWQVFGWPYETTAAMTRLVFSGLFDRHPGIKIITHHAGAMVPFFEKRIEHAYGVGGVPEIRQAASRLQRQPHEYFRLFYNDTALMGGTAGLSNAYAYFGGQRLLFGTDTPFDGTGGETFTRETLFSIDALTIPPAEKELIYAGNAIRLLRLEAPLA